MAKNLLEEALHLDENGQKVRDINLEKYHPYLQCCKAGAGGAEIIFLINILLYITYCRQFGGCQDKFKTYFCHT